MFSVSTVAYRSAALSFSAPWVYTAMDQSTQRAKPSFSRSSVMLPFWHRGRKTEKITINETERLHFNETSTAGKLPWLYRVKDGSQYDLVGATLQDDLNISLQETGFGEEFGLCCEWLWRLCTIRLPSECGTLERRKQIKTLIFTSQSRVKCPTAIPREAHIISTAIPHSQPLPLGVFLCTVFWYNLFVFCVLLLSTFNRCHLAVYTICIPLWVWQNGYKHNKCHKQTGLWTARHKKNHFEMVVLSSNGRWKRLVILSGPLAKLGLVKEIDGEI